LNVSNNISLFYVYCRFNQLSTKGLNDFFNTLPYNNNDTLWKIVYIYANSGTNDCNQSIAWNKGWSVYIYE